MREAFYLLAEARTRRSRNDRELLSNMGSRLFIGRETRFPFLTSVSRDRTSLVSERLELEHRRRSKKVWFTMNERSVKYYNDDTMSFQDDDGHEAWN